MSIKEELFYSYMAGFVDADGSISVKSMGKTRPYVPYLAVCNCNFEVIKLFAEHFGNGKTRRREWRTKNERQNWRPCYEFCLTARSAAQAIRVLYPYLRIKKRQGQLAIRLSNLRMKYQHTRWKPETRIKCNQVYQKIKDKCKALNKRGTL